MIRKIEIRDGVGIVPLTKGYFATIDASDIHLVDCFDWHAKTAIKLNGDVRSAYAARSDYTGGKQKTVQMHRIIMRAGLGQLVDHINGNGLDNRRENLRLATSSQNSQNRHVGLRNTSGAKGVVFHKQSRKWQAQIHTGKKSLYLGIFDNIEDASSAYVTASAMFHGQFGCAS